MMNLLTAIPDWTAPTPPDPALDLMPENADTFWEGLWQISKGVLPQILPSFSQCLGVCVSIFAVVLLLSVVENLPGGSKKALRLSGATAIGILFLGSARRLIGLGVETIQSVGEYGKALIPVLTAALAGSGGTGTSAALYAGTTVLNSLLGSLISNVIVPMLYIFLCFSLTHAALGEDTTKKLKGLEIKNRKTP